MQCSHILGGGLDDWSISIPDEKNDIYLRWQVILAIRILRGVYIKQIQYHTIYIIDIPE